MIFPIEEGRAEELRVRLANSLIGESPENEDPIRGVGPSIGEEVGEVRVSVIAGVPPGVESESLEHPVKVRLPSPIADRGKVV